MDYREDVAQTKARYSRADDEMWRHLYEQQVALAREHGCRAYIRGLDRLGLPADRAIHLEELNEQVRPLTDWRFVPASGAMKMGAVFECLSKRRFPLNLKMRGPEERYFAELPDLFHDLFGHGPILLDREIAALYEQFGAVAMKNIEDPPLIRLVGRLFWFTMEVGLIREEGALKAYGAALLTSFREINNAIESCHTVSPLSIDRLERAAYLFTEVQQTYFETPSFAALGALLAQLDQQRAELRTTKTA
jgi:phenylalanine-4-hydroxylase